MNNILCKLFLCLIKLDKDYIYNKCITNIYYIYKKDNLYKTLKL